MKNRFLSAFKSSSLSILPIVIIVLILSIPGIGLLTLGMWDYIMIGLGALALITGLSLFQIGAQNGIIKVGEYMGSSLSQQSNLFIVIIFALALGTLITCAEPSILIFSKQVTIIANNSALNAIVLIGSIALGVGIFVVIGVMRVIFQKSLKLWYLLFYFVCFLLICLIAFDPNKARFLPIIFDSGGVTTGSATVPFILALGAGVAAVRGGKNSSTDSFGLVGIASVGPILTMCILILIQSNVDPYNFTLPTNFADASCLAAIPASWLPGNGALGTMLEVLIALTPIFVIFYIYEKLYIKLPKKKVLQLLIGFLYSFFGLVLFLSATSTVMGKMGSLVGVKLGEKEPFTIIMIAFVIGLVTILCEPAVHVLTTQMEKISAGQIKKITVLATLSLGVGIAIALSAIRAIFNFSILYYIIPLYGIGILLMFVCPDIYTAMAFDSGGTASGPMSTSFVLPMIIGIVYSIGGATADFYDIGFGVVALIAITPVIAIQVLGLVQNVKKYSLVKLMQKGTMDVNDAQIIHFN
ncbi:MAG: DUF1538 domain-containing protein [Bacilli bacterium]|nr:DUF1538 domain-containing protein [Bacilli bacterium]